MSIKVSFNEISYSLQFLITKTSTNHIFERLNRLSITMKHIEEYLINDKGIVHAHEEFKRKTFSNPQLHR